jgi:outer membrane protein assembly factor BamD (BamD/ComL family)
LARLQEAQKLLEEERYEEAIVAFGQVEAQEYREQASKGIQEAQDRYAEKRRKEAAALVLKAREETGQARKASLLKALEILEETNRRYPNNRYAAKIQQNINDVIGQIRAIDPGFRR